MSEVKDRVFRVTFDLKYAPSYVVKAKNKKEAVKLAARLLAKRTSLKHYKTYVDDFTGVRMF